LVADSTEELAMGIDWLLMMLASIAAGVDELAANLELLGRQDAEIISVRYQDQPLREVIDDLDERLPTSVRADWDALDFIGVEPRQTVRLTIESAPASSVLRSIEIMLGREDNRPRFEAFGGQLVLTSGRGSAAMRHTAAYDVRDLIAGDRQDGVGAAIDAPQPVPGDDEAAPQEEEEAEVSGAAPPRSRTPGEQFMMTLTDHVDPDAWVSFGGDRAEIGERDGVLIVTAPATTHRRLRETLEQLRAASPTGVAVEAAILDLSRDAFERLERRHQPGSSALARALTISAEAQPLWTLHAQAALGDSIFAESSDGGAAVRFELTAAYEKTDGVLRLSINVSSKAGEDQRSLATTAALTGPDRAVIVELPAATANPAAGTRLLVVVPKRM
jgi:hypothetical protein